MVTILAWNVPLKSLIFLKRSVVFPILLFSSISLHCLLKKATYFSWYSLEHSIQLVYLIFSPLSFTSLIFSAIFKASSENHFAFLHFFFLSWGWFWSLPPIGSDGKESACKVRDLDSIPGLGRAPGEGNGNPFQYSCLGNLVNRGDWWGYSPQGCKESDTTV